MDESGFSALLHNPVYVWSALSVIFLLIEAFGLPGLGLLFAGLGSLVVGLSLFNGYVQVDDVSNQLILFFVSSALWAILLWKPMQKLRVGKRAGDYHNIIGGTAYVGSHGINRKTGGEVTWSGTIMRAELCRNAGVDTVEPGAVVVITDVTGATLIVRPKN